MRDNPLHAAVFGPDPERRERRLRRFFGPVLGHVAGHGTLTGAWLGGHLAGVLGMIAPGSCQPRPAARIRLALALAPTTSPVAMMRIRRWLRAWENGDPAIAHWHFGPLAVVASQRGQGIGRRLMEQGCVQADMDGTEGWLETDRESNARLYETLGFVVVREERVLGVPGWFMRRAAGGPSPRSRCTAGHEPPSGDPGPWPGRPHSG